MAFEAKERDPFDYAKMMDHVEKLKAVTMITTGRTGTDLFQSLLDSHPEVLTFNGSLFFHDFWKDSFCVKFGNFDLEDWLDEFIGKHIEKFKSKYDYIEQKQRLGENFNESVDIDLNKFRFYMRNLLAGRELNSKNTLLAIYAAYALCLGQSIESKKIFLHHIHHVTCMREYLNDFPDSKIIVMTRDPRANFVSGVENWRSQSIDTDNEQHLYFYIKRILEDANAVVKFDVDYGVFRLEDMGNKDALLKVTNWLGISYHECMQYSTWAGKLWHGDFLSKGKKDSKGFSASLIKNRWQERLGRLDKYVLNFLMNHRLKHYRYEYDPVRIWDYVFVFIAILLPMRYERRFLSLSYINDSGKFKTSLKNILYYVKRVGLFYKFYLKAVTKNKFDHPVISL